MPQRTPTLVRKRIVELDLEGYATREIAELFGLAESGVRRVRERGTVEPLPRAGGRRSPMDDGDVARRVRDHVAARPDATRAELRAALGLASRTGPTSPPAGRAGTTT